MRNQSSWQVRQIKNIDQMESKFPPRDLQQWNWSIIIKKCTFFVYNCCYVLPSSILESTNDLISCKETKKPEKSTSYEGTVKQEANFKNDESNKINSITPPNPNSLESRAQDSLERNDATVDINRNRRCNRRTRNYRSRVLQSSSSSSSSFVEEEPLSILTPEHLRADPTGLEINEGSYVRTWGNNMF